MTGSRRGLWCGLASCLVIAGSAFLGRAAVAQSPTRVLSWVEAIQGPTEAPLRWPVAVAASPNDEIAVADVFGTRVLLFRRVGASWQFIRSVELSSSPIGLAYDGSRFVASLRQEGGLVALEGEEHTPAPMPLPVGVVPGAIAASPDGALLVFDAASESVVSLSPDGALLRRVPIGLYVTALAAGEEGQFFAAVLQPAAVLAFDGQGELRTSYSIQAAEPTPAWPVGIAVEPGGDLLVVDRRGARILVLDASGRWIGVGSRGGWEPGLLRFPSSLARLPNGDLLVADQGNARAQIFRRTDRSAGQ